MRYLTALIVLVAGVAGLGTARAGDIYCNNQGHDCSDRPSPGATVVRTVTNPTAGYGDATRSETQPPADNATSSAATAVDAAANERLKQEITRQAVQKDVAKTRAEQCKQAQEKYQKSVEARRVYRLNKAGEREYLSDAEADQGRLNARLEMDRFCGNKAS